MTAIGDRKPVLLPPGGGQALSVMGQPWRIKLDGSSTAGALAVVEGTFPVGAGAPLHRHAGHDECFHVRSGTFRFRSGDDEIVLGAGGFCYLPRTVPHGFTNVGDAPATLMGILSPAGFEQYFRDVAGLPPGPPDPEALREILSRHDQELLEP